MLRSAINSASIGSGKLPAMTMWLASTARSLVLHRKRLSWTAFTGYKLVFDWIQMNRSRHNNEAIALFIIVAWVEMTKAFPRASLREETKNISAIPGIVLSEPPEYSWPACPKACEPEWRQKSKREKKGNWKKFKKKWNSFRETLRKRKERMVQYCSTTRQAGKQTLETEQSVTIAARLTVIVTTGTTAALVSSTYTTSRVTVCMHQRCVKIETSVSFYKSCETKQKSNTGRADAPMLTPLAIMAAIQGLVRNTASDLPRLDWYAKNYKQLILYA